VTGGFRASLEDPPQSVTVTLTADPGPRARIGTVEVLGTEAIDKRVVLKTLMIKPGEIYSDSSLHQGMMNLQKTELFRQVRVGLADTAPGNSSDTLVDVHVRAQLAEYPLRRARVSGGYGALDCLRAMGWVDLVSFQLVHDRANSISDPTQGSTLVTELRVSPAFLGSDEFMRFIRFTAGYTAHIPLGTSSPGRVFSWRIRAGTVFAPKVTLPTG